MNWHEEETQGSERSAPQRPRVERFQRPKRKESTEVPWLVTATCVPYLGVAWSVAVCDWLKLSYLLQKLYTCWLNFSLFSKLGCSLCCWSSTYNVNFRLLACCLSCFNSICMHLSSLLSTNYMLDIGPHEDQDSVVNRVLILPRGLYLLGKKNNKLLSKSGI